MNVCFVLPAPGNNPVGGFKVVYEYANWLTRRGHHVSIVHHALRRMDVSISYKVWRTIRYMERSITGTYRPNGWFDLDANVDLLWAPTISSRYVPRSDVIVATSWETAEAIASYPHDRGRKVYLIQHIEEWSGSRSRIEATWRLPIKKIVVSNWLRRELEAVGECAVVINNGLDRREYFIDNPPQRRSPCSIVMPWSTSVWKGSADGLVALKEVRALHESLEVNIFGVDRRPGSLLGWINYHRNPTRLRLRELYNRAAIFVGPSRFEGWGLPPCEAMLCGAAVAITSNNGHKEFAIHGKNALLSPVQSPMTLAENIKLLITDSSLRIQLALAGANDMKRYTWEKAGSAMESTLIDYYNE